MGRRTAADSAPRRTRPKVTPELLTDWVRVSDPRISPDGKRVAYVRTPVSRSEEHPRSEIWCVRADGSDDHRLTSGSGQDGAPRWSPDGKWLAFTSDRVEAEKAQLYVMPVDGGEAMQFTRRKTAVSAPEWSADSRSVAFLSVDEPTEQEELDKKEKRDQVVDGDNLKRARLYVVEPPVGEPRQVSPDGECHVWLYCWSPDGRELAAVTTPSPLLADQRDPNDLLIASASDGADGATERSRVVLTYPSTMGDPRWSTDGTRVAFLASTGRIQTVDQIFLLDLKTGKFRAAIKEYLGSVDSVAWTPDGNLLFSGLENIHGAINELNLTTGRWRSVLEAADCGKGTFGTTFSLARGGRIAVTRTESDSPPQVFMGAPGQPLKVLTAANPELGQAPLVKAEVVSWRGPDDLEIFGLVYRPRRGTKPYPTVLVIHGGPAHNFSDRIGATWHDWTQLLVAQGYAVLMPNPRGSTGRGAAFTDGNVQDLGGKEWTDDLSGLDMLIEQGVADPNRLALAGWSHGGYITAWGVTQTNRFKAGIMGAGVSNMVSDQGSNDIPGFNLDYWYEDIEHLYADLEPIWKASPMRYITRVTTPTLVLHGEQDDRVHPTQGREFYCALKALKVPTQMVTYPREPHGFKEREHQLDVQRRIVAWLKHWL
jgi:dipeptidyl aminopeptidase/acylaminoacyl peptidase